MTGIEKLTTKELQFFVKNLKEGIMSFLNLPEEKRLVPPNSKSCPPIAGAQLSWSMLLIFEREIKGRGLDPAHPIFGRDIVGEFAEMFGEL